MSLEQELRIAKARQHVERACQVLHQYQTRSDGPSSRYVREMGRYCKLALKVLEYETPTEKD